MCFAAQNTSLTLCDSTLVLAQRSHAKVWNIDVSFVPENDIFDMRRPTCVVNDHHAIILCVFGERGFKPGESAENGRKIGINSLQIALIVVFADENVVEIGSH